MSTPTDDFVHMWKWFATHCHGYSPLYERISLAIAGDRALIDLVRSAPPDVHLPPALLAVVHYLVLDQPDHPLAQVYAGRSDADPGPLFLDLCRKREGEVMSLLSTRRIQTNECGRSAVVAPGITWIASRLTQPLALVDVGASAGINLLCDEFRLDYGDHGATGPPDSPVQITCTVTGGNPPIADRLPKFIGRVGIDRSPINVADPDDARWLLACVWPDTGRLERTAASIRLAQEHPPTVLAGDAIDMLPGAVADLPPEAAVVILTTWAFAYFSHEARRLFVELLAAESHRRPVAWLSAEGPGTVDGLAEVPAATNDEEAPDILGVVLFDGGRHDQHVLAHVQEHGTWINWEAAP